MTLLHRHSMARGTPSEPPLPEPLFHFLAPNATAEMQGVLLGTPPLSEARASTILASDYQGVYQEFAAGEPAWAGGRVTGAVGSRVVYATDGVGDPLAEMPYVLSAPESTNYFLNSEAPANQTISGLSGNHTFSCIGTGTVALTGGVTGSVSDGSPLTANPGGVDVIFSISGPPDSVQAEPGDSVTPPIPTAGASVTRDACALSFALANWSDTEGTIYLEADISADSLIFGGMLDIASGLVGLTDGPNTAKAAAFVSGPCQIGWAYQASGMRLCVNGVWSPTMSYDGGMLTGLLDIFRNADQTGAIRDIRGWGEADEELIDALMPEPPDYGTDFVMVVKTTAQNETFNFPCRDMGTYDAMIDWGDGGPSTSISAYNDVNLTHAYVNPGAHLVRVSGELPGVYFNNGLDDLKVIAILQLGSIGSPSAYSMFFGCSNMVLARLSSLDAVDSMYQMFRNCDSLISIDLSGIDTSTVTNTYQMMRGCDNLVSIDFSGFSAASVITMGNMFNDCSNVSSESMDSFLAALYASRMATTWATPTVNISPCHAPSGVYQDATPPTTGEEFRYKLENDPDAEGFNTWAITI